MFLLFCSLPQDKLSDSPNFVGIRQQHSPWQRAQRPSIPFFSLLRSKDHMIKILKGNLWRRPRGKKKEFEVNYEQECYLAGEDGNRGRLAYS